MQCCAGHVGGDALGGGSFSAGGGAIAVARVPRLGRGAGAAGIGDEPGDGPVAKPNGAVGDDLGALVFPPPLSILDAAIAVVCHRFGEDEGDEPLDLLARLGLGLQRAHPAAAVERLDEGGAPSAGRCGWGR